MNLEMQTTLDLVIIGRCFAALVWGGVLAMWLQYNRLGQFLARERTWITVVMGVGVDMLLGIGAQWWEMWLIVALSAVGIIARSLWNESDNPPDLNSYKVKWSLGECIDRLGDIIGGLGKALDAEDEATRVRLISKALGCAHEAQQKVMFARYGEVKRVRK